MPHYLEKCSINHKKWLSVLWWRSLHLPLLALPLLVDNVDGHLATPNFQTGINAMAGISISL